jgi:hypothetical protein
MDFKHNEKFAGLSMAIVAAAMVSPLCATDVFKTRMLTGKVMPGQPIVSVQIEVASWTTPEEIRQFQDILAQSGTDAFLAAFSNANKGVVRFMYSRGWNLPIHVALTVPTEKGKKVLLFFNRQNWDPESSFGMGRNYFMAMELNLDEKGKGDGRFYEDVRIKLIPLAGTIDIETYESPPKLFPKVQEVIKKTTDKK